MPRSRLLTAAVLALLPLSANAEPLKNDVLGLYTGMPTSAVANVVKTKGWRCKNINDPVVGKAPDPITGDYSFTCDTSIGQLDFTLAGSLNDAPLYQLRLLFRSADQPENVARSISQQYLKEPDPIPGRNGGTNGYRWKLDNGSILQVLNPIDSYTLELSSAALREENLKARAAKDLASHPTPKF